MKGKIPLVFKLALPIQQIKERYDFNYNLSICTSKKIVRKRLNAFIFLFFL